MFGLTLRLLPYFMYATSEGSGETVWMRRLAWAFTGRICDKYHNLIGWVHSCLKICEQFCLQCLWERLRGRSVLLPLRLASSFLALVEISTLASLSEYLMLAWILRIGDWTDQRDLHNLPLILRYYRILQYEACVHGISSADADVILGSFQRG